MNTERDVPGGPADSLGERRAEFLARITASATHEFRNILAIVKESAGLVSDLMAAAGPDRSPDPKKTDWALNRIALQVSRGSDLSTSLNRIMHGLDQAEETVALSDAVHHAGLLAQRFARQQRRTIQMEECDTDPLITTNALDLYRGLVTAMEWCVDQVEEGGEVVVEPTTVEGKAAVRLRAGPSSPALAERDEDARDGLRAAVADLPAEIRADPSGSLLLVFAESR